MIKTLIEIIIVSTCISVLFGSNAQAQPNITAQAWLVADVDGNVLDGSRMTEIRSIASITKLMTVMVMLDSKQDLTEVIKTKTYNKNITRQMLLDLTIVKSDNTAAMTLCQNYPTGFIGCIAAMNEKAHELQMTDTIFFEPTGLNSGNVSTANDLLKLVQSASKYQPIIDASNKDHVRILSKKNKWADFRNTNPTVGKGYDFIVSKTGFINKSGGCIVMMLNTLHGVRTVVLLGSKNTKTRIPEAQLIAKLY